MTFHQYAPRVIQHDSRDLETRRVELLQEREDWIAAVGSEPGDDPASAESWADENETDADELAELEALSAEVYGWKDGVTLIREDTFEQYAREYAEEIGAIPDDNSWPATCIDWSRAADDLMIDFQSVEYQGDTYRYR